VALAVSLDIVNAFNSLPWGKIREALEFHRIPPYLQNVVRAYLRDQCIMYTDHGVPQRSVLGPLLWDLVYDAVLRMPMPPDSALTCYADDMLVLVWGSAWRRTVRLAEIVGAYVVASIKGLGLEVTRRRARPCGFAAGPVTGSLQRVITYG
jgi:hypothetical protein